jgi:hypothetical protein
MENSFCLLLLGGQHTNGVAILLSKTDQPLSAIGYTLRNEGIWITMSQALDRTQPILPLWPGLPERQTHDYERYGTTTLFAALNVAAGKIIAQCQPRHRHQEFLRFLKQIDTATSISFWTTTARTSIPK